MSKKCFVSAQHFKEKNQSLAYKHQLPGTIGSFDMSCINVDASYLKQPYVVDSESSAVKNVSILM
jgi:hypothetical protein